MTIEIAMRLRPFSHLPGTSCLVPGSAWVMKAFPARLEFKHAVTGLELAFDLPILGPVEGFTVVCDLEKERAALFGRGKSGYFHYTVEASDVGLVLDLGSEKIVLCDGGELRLKASKERLSLGSHRKLDWELTQRRGDLSEILPVWFFLGSKTPCAAGSSSYLREVQPLQVAPHFLNLFRAAFEGILVPRGRDTSYQALFEEPLVEGSPLIFLTEGARLIRELFFREEEGGLFFLPTLSPLFHKGRFTGLKTSWGDEVDFEWSKKFLRRIVIRSQGAREVRLKLGPHVKRFRRSGVVQEASAPLILGAKETAELDRFEA